MRIHLRVLPTLLAATVALAACSGGGDVGPSSTSPPSPRPSSTASLSIVSPKNGEVLSDPVQLRVALKGAELVSTTSTDLQPNQGHLHVSVDDRLISMTSGLEQLLPDLPPGRHLLKVEFVANDHFPFDPRVLAVVSFKVGPA